MWWMCAYIPACVAAPHDRVLPTVRIKLFKDWQFRTTDREHEKSSSGIKHLFFLKKKVIEKQPVFSQPTLALVTKHWIHCAMVTMVTRAIYLRVKRALMQWADCRDEVPELILFEKQKFLTITWYSTLELVINRVRVWLMSITSSGDTCLKICSNLTISNPVFTLDHSVQ